MHDAIIYSFKLLIIHFSNFNNPCEFLSAFVNRDGCPCALLHHGIPCTCPFNPSSIDLPPTVFQLEPQNEVFRLLFEASFYFVYLVQ